jgi:hypothetical protein
MNKLPFSENVKTMQCGDSNAMWGQQCNVGTIQCGDSRPRLSIERSSIVSRLNLLIRLRVNLPKPLTRRGFPSFFTLRPPAFETNSTHLNNRNRGNIAIRVIPPHTLAPIPVTRLWTPRTRLKLSNLKTQTFD